MARTALAGIVLVVAMQALAAGASEPIDEVNWEDFPLEKEALIETDRRQQRELRRFANFCRQTRPIILRNKSAVRACVKPDIDRFVRESGDKALIAYHWAMPTNHRYDPERNSVQRSRVAERARKILAGEMEPPPFQP